MTGSSGSFFSSGGTSSLVRSPLVGCVVLQPPEGTNQDYMGPWSVTGPNGESVDASTSSSQGLQEAINYAVANGYPLRLMGRGGRARATTVPSTRPPVLFTSVPIVFPPMFLQDIDFSNVSIIYTGGGPSPVLTFDSCMMVRFKSNGQIIGSGSGPSVLFQPAGFLPIDVQVTLTASRFEFGSIGATSGGGSDKALVKFDCSYASIIGNEFKFIELECIQAFGFGIRVINAGSVSGTTIFRQNKIAAPNIHGFITAGISLGSRIVDGTHYFGDHVTGNICEVMARGGGPAAVGIHCFGNYNTFIGGGIDGEEGGLLDGVQVVSNDTGAGGNHNVFLGISVKDQTGVVYNNNGTGNYAIINGTVQ